MPLIELTQEGTKALKAGDLLYPVRGGEAWKVRSISPFDVIVEQGANVMTFSTETVGRYFAQEVFA